MGLALNELGGPAFHQWQGKSIISNPDGHGDNDDGDNDGGHGDKGDGGDGHGDNNDGHGDDGHGYNGHGDKGDGGNDDLIGIFSSWAIQIVGYPRKTRIPYKL